MTCNTLWICLLKLIKDGFFPIVWYSMKLTSDLPPQSEFHNELTGEDLSDEDYLHVQRVWDEFEMECLGDLHDLWVVSIDFENEF